VNVEAVRRIAANLVPTGDQQRFVRMVLEELGHLHEGNVARYRLRLAEFRAWKQMQVKL
jgi:hypothetical protein